MLLLHYNLITSSENGKFSGRQGEWWQIGQEKNDCRQSVELQIKSNNIICYLNAPTSPEQFSLGIQLSDCEVAQISHPRLQSG